MAHAGAGAAMSISLYEECGEPTPDGPCTRMRGHLSERHWHAGIPVNEGPYVCPGCHAIAQACAPGCVDAEMARDREEFDGECWEDDEHE